MNTTNEKARALQVQSSERVLDGAHLRGLLGCGLGFAGGPTQNVPTHVWAQLFAAHTGESLNVWAVFGRYAGTSPLVHNAVAAQVQFACQLAHPAREPDGAGKWCFV